MDITFAPTKINQIKTHIFLFKAANNQEDSYQMLHKSFLCQRFSIQIFEIGYEIIIIIKKKIVLCYGPTFITLSKNSQTFCKICPISQSQY